MLAVGLEEPVAGVGVAVEGDGAAGLAQGFFQPVDFGLGLKRVALGEVAEVGCLGVAVVAGAGTVEDDDGAHVLGIGYGEVEGVKGAEGEADDGEASAGPAGVLVQKADGRGEVGLGLRRVEAAGQDFGAVHVGRDLPVIEVGGEGDEA